MSRRVSLAFAAMCLLSGSSWLVEAALPPALPGALNLLVDNAVLALTFFLLSQHSFGKVALPMLGYVALLLAVPGALVSLAEGQLSSTTIVLIYTLVPSATIFFAAQSSEEDLLSLLGPALGGVAGAALILPFALPGSIAGGFWLAAILLSAIVSGFAGLRLHSLLSQTPMLPVAALAAVAGALVALPLYLFERPTVVLLPWPQALLTEGVHLVFEAAILLLTVFLLRDAAAIAFSTRFLLIPLVTIGEGYALLHPATSWTLPVGVLLLAGGSVLLMRSRHQP